MDLPLSLVVHWISLQISVLPSLMEHRPRGNYYSCRYSRCEDLGGGEGVE